MLRPVRQTPRRQRVERVAHPRVSQPHCQARQLGAAGCRALGELQRRRHRGLDVAAYFGIGPGVRQPGPLCQERQTPPHRVDGNRIRPDHRQQFVAAGIESPAVQHCGSRQRRGARIIHPALFATVVGAMPGPAGGHLVHDVGGIEFDALDGERLVEHRRQVPVAVIAGPAVSAVVVDHHSDHRVRPSRGRDSDQMRDALGHVVGQVGAQDAAQLAPVDGDQDEAEFRDEPEDGGKCGDQRTGAVEMEVEL